MAAFEEGFDVLKLFPSEQCGGIAFLKAIGGPLPHIKFMPTGGISLASLGGYLQLDNVVAVGGSWITPSKYTLNGLWTEIQDEARKASENVRQTRVLSD